MPTTTTLAASPTSATVGKAESLTATVVATDGTHPAGSVQFAASGTLIGSPVAVNASGVATTTTTFESAGPEAVTAVFTPTQTKYKPSTGTLTLTVNTGGVPESGMIPLAVVVPSVGAFTLTVGTVGTVTLTRSGATATAATTKITVSDTRSTYPGWSVTGQDTTWSGAGTANDSTEPGDQLGWTPTGSGRLPRGVTLGSAVAPGLGAIPAVLASVYSGSGNGYGMTVLGANLILAIPVTRSADPYSASLTITVVATSA